jgi:hypothetical protein
MRKILVLATLLGAAGLQAQDGPPPGGPGGRPPGPGVVNPAKGDRIAWFGTWDAGLAEAQRTNRPIMLVSAAPQCHEVPGVW